MKGSLFTRSRGNSKLAAEGDATSDDVAAAGVAMSDSVAAEGVVDVVSVAFSAPQATRQVITARDHKDCY